MTRVFMVMTFVAGMSFTAPIAASPAYTAYPGGDTYNLVFTPAGGTATKMTVSGSNEVGIAESGTTVQYYWYNVAETTIGGASAPLISYLEARNPSASTGPSTFDFNFNGVDTAYTGGNFMNLAAPNQPLISGIYNLAYYAAGSTGTYSTGIATLAITDVTAIPEPSTIFLLGTGILGLTWVTRTKFVRADVSKY